MRYLILGASEARDENGDALPLGGSRLRALLAALALRPGRPVPVADLVDDVWADEPPADAPAALQALVGRLRKALGREAVASTPGGYRLTAGPQDVDLYEFERLARQGGAALDSGSLEEAAHDLRSALALWRGPALADLPDGDHGHALRPEARRLATLERRIETDLRRVTAGRATAPASAPSAPSAADLVAELTELVAAHPYDERFRAQLIRALRADGRQADALAAYEDARRALAEGLGTDPGPELAALHRELLAPAPAFTPAADVFTAARAAGSVPAGGFAQAAGAGSGAGSGSGADETGLFHVKPARSNLRPRLTSFVGREPELRAIRDDLTRSRLVTLTGPGGSGKTRLAEEAAARQEPASGPGTAPPEVWIAELAPVEDPEAVPDAVLSALGLRETTLLRDNTLDGAPPRTDPVDVLVDRLGHGSRPAPVLLILDNCEHVIGAAALLAETLLTRCPQLRVLATSREPLAVPGESVRPVGPLPADPAHRLFTERARAVRPGFDPEQGPAHDADAVAEICRRLDGLPLAIELAAARLRLLGPRQIADRLDDRFRLLTGGSRTVLPRQQTLRAVVDWSWDLLDEDERTALCQVSVFAGGWDLAAAEAVISTPAAPGRPAADTADLLGALVDKSLVVAAPAADGAMRYRLLETIHEYATERSAETPDVRAAAERAHTGYFLALVEEAEPLLRSGDQLPWIQRLETDLDNIRAALQRTTAPTAPSEAEAARLVLGMGWFWWLRSYRSEGLSWTQRSRSLGPEPTDESDPRFWPRMNLHLLWFFYAAESGHSAMAHGDTELHALVTRVADVFATSPTHGVRFPGLLWPMTSYLTGSSEDTRGKINKAVDNAREHGEPWEYGVILMFRAHMLVDMPGGMPGIDDDLEELRDLSRRVGDRWMRAQVASAVAEAGMMRGRYEEARTAYEEALVLCREVGAHAEAPFHLARLAELSYRTGDPADAQRRLDASEAEAERHQAHDAMAYIRYLRATMAFYRGDIAEARRHVTAAMEEAGRGGPPSHFTVAMAGLAARIAVYEPEPGGGPAVGARGLAECLVAARDAQCAESVTGLLADGAVTVLAKLGHHAAAVRVFAASDEWRRVSSPRSAGERAEIDAAAHLCREELGAARYERERTVGRALSLDDVIDVLDEVVAEGPALSGS
ncbi:AfsR/SARP family transcriptional regulator [Streptomyces sp. NBC_00525]|uniref:AfsR/SARP family transcriptional regulator n=1 Tax=Streptomyces sp. NBC_00525 TaxID=2903660 RepID=UPI002E82053B|nr:BTAD domain-containing putative transcriptional regulator [Streptomyces sp. NBC_00525]WUC94310.1 winged helix-turn-helix domain-containing protein [Streptomyces sp. NBC_00525]